MRKISYSKWVVAGLVLATATSVTACKKRGGKGASEPSDSGESGGAKSDKVVPPGGNLLKNADFEDGTSLPWTTSFTQPAKGEAKIEGGALCLTIDDAGQNNWDAQIRHREMVMQKGHTYSFAFRIWADQPTMSRPKIGMAGPPYAEYWNRTLRLTKEPQQIQGQFTMAGNDDPTVEFAFHLGGNMARNAKLPLKVCIDDVYLTDRQFTPPPKAEKRALAQIRINQLGYIVNGKKVAALVSESSSAKKWELKRSGQVVLSGQTEPFGLDSDSGDNIHIIDFTPVRTAGAGYVLEVDGQPSPSFAIKNELYSKLKYDSLAYFYHNRSGIEIKMPYARRQEWARPAGHLNSDKNVPCGRGAGCDYSLDVSGGWYDAGDHGKYVVNGGIAVWTMQNQYERAKVLGTAEAFDDGKLNIPESGNGIPDILDEARWEMEFLLKMQVPAGKPNEGMVHHKMHDENWTALGIRPDEAELKMKRFLRPVSTAATLNVAATAAQASRLWSSFDPAFSKKALTAAEKAYRAAKANPKVLALPSDQNGGGPYDDKELDDDFFWAAAELYVTTKNAEYKQDMMASKFWGDNMTQVVDGVPTSMNWAYTDALGTISLATVPGALLAGELPAQRKKIVDAAERYLQLIEIQGYRMPFSAGDSGKYPWGSNSFLVNNLVILALAHDYTKQDKYLEGVVLGMDYLLGRNALSQSYVSGYGSKPLEHPHHRFWSKQVDSRFPSAAPGALSGGPNSGLQDPYVKAAGLAGCLPQKCFVDNIEAWSVNEITVNWNAPLAWVSAYLDEQAKFAKAALPAAAPAKAAPAAAKGGKAPAAPAKKKK